MTELEHTKYLRDLRRKMVAHFGLEELQTLALDLSIDWDILPGEEKVSKVNSLVLHQARRGRLADLMALLREERPNVEWPDIPPPEQQIRDEGEIIPDSVREAALQDYLHKMGTQVADKRLPNGGYTAVTIALARAYTEAVVSRLDKRRLLVLIRFLGGISLGTVYEWRGFDLSGANLMRANLSEADLIRANLREADLRGAILIRANLREADLSGANLREADLSGANLRGAILSGAILGRANLSGANLRRANLSGADLHEIALREADLYGADLHEANLREADLSWANLREAKLIRAYLIRAKLIRANLSRTNLHEANLYGANLSRADLSEADLHGADLHEANLREADLNQTKNWTFEQLNRAKSLEGSFMPNGEKVGGNLNFERWKVQYLAKQSPES